ncbi:hypothetical protein D3C71_1928940 [compost metagenome]
MHHRLFPVGRGEITVKRKRLAVRLLRGKNQGYTVFRESPFATEIHDLNRGIARRAAGNKQPV